MTKFFDFAIVKISENYFNIPLDKSYIDFSKVFVYSEYEENYFLRKSPSWKVLENILRKSYNPNF